MIKFSITATALLVSMLSNSQDNGKAIQGDFNGRLCDIGRGLCNTTPPNENNKSTRMKNYTAYKQDYNVVMFELNTKTLNQIARICNPCPQSIKISLSLIANPQNRNVMLIKT